MCPENWSEVYILTGEVVPIPSVYPFVLNLGVFEVYLPDQCPDALQRKNTHKKGSNLIGQTRFRGEGLLKHWGSILYPTVSCNSLDIRIYIAVTTVKIFFQE